jgi:hypothetical protein
MQANLAAPPRSSTRRSSCSCLLSPGLASHGPPGLRKDHLRARRFPERVVYPRLLRLGRDGPKHQCECQGWQLRLGVSSWIIPSTQKRKTGHDVPNEHGRTTESNAPASSANGCRLRRAFLPDVTFLPARFSARRSGANAMADLMAAIFPAEAADAGRMLGTKWKVRHVQNARLRSLQHCHDEPRHPARSSPRNGLLTPRRFPPPWTVLESSPRDEARRIAAN